MQAAECGFLPRLLQVFRERHPNIHVELHEMTSGELVGALKSAEIQLAVLVGGATPEELEINVADIRDRLGPKLRLMRAAGAQGEVLDALREGQMAFFVAIDEIARNVDVSVAQFREDREHFIRVLREAQVAG